MARARDHYQVLGVAQDASAEDIHRAYRRLARRYHPDLNSDADARARFGELSDAYEVLHDPDRRALYDRSSDRPADRGPRPRAPSFVQARPQRDVPRFLDDEMDRSTAAPIDRSTDGFAIPGLRVVVVWDAPRRPQLGSRLVSRGWPRSRWWPG